MKPVYRGVAVGVVQCLIVLSVAGKYALDRERLPRVWAKAAPRIPSLISMSVNPTAGRISNTGIPRPMKAAIW